MKKFSHIIQRKSAKPILLDYRYSSNGLKKPIVIFCHGYKGFKDWGCWDLFADELASNNIFFLKFNFSHNGGTMENPIDFPDLNAFGNNNYCKELDDLGAVVDFVTSATNEFSAEVDTNEIILIGHSRGGGAVSIKASEDNRVSKVVSLASVSDYKQRFPQGAVLEQWEKDGVAYIENARTKQRMPHYFQFFENFIANESRLTISKAVQALRIPHLIIQGALDETVPLAEAKNLHSWSPNSKLVVLSEANHVFGASHPWTMNVLPNDLVQVSVHIIKFIKTCK